MPKINRLDTDTTIKDNDYLIGYDGESGNAAKKYKLEDLQTYFDGAALDGYRTGRILAVVDEDFIESVYKVSSTKRVLLDGSDATEEDNSIVATSSTVLQVGSAISSTVFSYNFSDGDFITIDDGAGNRDFGVVSSIDEDEDVINLRTGQGLQDYTLFTTSRGFQNTVTLYQNGESEIDSDLKVTGDLTVEGNLLDSDGNDIIQTDPVTLSGNNTFTGTNTFNDHVTTFEEGIRIDDSDNFTYRFLPASTAPNNDDVLAVDTDDNNEMKFKSIGELLPFAGTGVDAVGADSISTWAEGNNTDDIPSSKLPTASDSVAGVIIAGTNLSVSANGTLNATGTVGTIAIQDEGSEQAGAATTLNFTGSGVEASASGDVATINVTAGQPTFGDAAGNVAEWAEGDNEDNIPFAKLGNVANNDNDFNTKQTFQLGLTIGENQNVFDILDKGSAVVQNEGLVANSDGDFVPATIPWFSATQEFTGINTFNSTYTTIKRENNGGEIHLERDDETPVDNDFLGFVQFRGYSLEREETSNFISLRSRYKSDTDYEYGRFILQTNYVTKSNDSFSSLNAFTIDRYGAEFSVPVTLDDNVTIGDSSTNTLTINATTTFEESITGSITEVVNDRDNTQSLKIWYGTEAQYDAIATKDANTIYYTT